MKVQLKLFVAYRTYLLPGEEGSAMDVQVPTNTRVSDLLRQFGLPEHESVENKLIFGNGPLTATPAPTGNRHMVVTKSPLAGALACSNSGGFFPTEMKRTGFERFIFEGQVHRPVYLWVKKGSSLREYGTAYVPEVTNEIGILPTRDFQTGRFEGTESISGPSLNEEYRRRPKPCAGERIFNLERLFLLRAGFTKAGDTLPSRMLEEPLPDGAGQGHVVELDQMLPEFYRLRGWDENGLPALDKLRSLGLDCVRAFEQGDPPQWTPRFYNPCGSGASAFGLQRVKSY